MLQNINVVMCEPQKLQDCNVVGRKIELPNFEALFEPIEKRKATKIAKLLCAKVAKCKACSMQDNIHLSGIGQKSCKVAKHLCCNV